MINEGDVMFTSRPALDSLKKSPHNVMSKALSWCFTLNNYTDADVARLSSMPSNVCYVIFGKELAASGTPHLQGYVRFSSRVRIATVKAFCGEGAHVETTRSVAASITYCKKEGDFHEFGEVPSGPGTRTDLDEFKASVCEGMLSAKDLREAHSEVWAKYPRFCLEYIQDNMPVPKVKQHELRPWQEALNDYLAEEPNDRHINFVVDYVGNEGKSWFAHWYCEKNADAQMILPGRLADMSYVLRQDIRVLFCDAPRSKQGEYLQYDFFEHVKNGFVFSTKYESRMKTLGSCHVVILMNEMPDKTKLSLDRYKIAELNDPVPIVLNGDLCH